MSDLGLALLLVVAAYVLGSIPSGYIVARALKGIDIRRSGSGHIGGSNVWAHVSFGAFLIVGLADAAKGALAVGVGQRLGLDPWVVVVGAWAAIIGQTWSLFLGGSGGRGIATLLGSLTVLAPRETIIFFLVLVLARRFRYGAVVLLLALGSLPLLTSAFGESAPVIGFTLGAFILHFSKRMLGNRLPWQIPPAQRSRVFLYRLLFDRDTREHMAPVYQKPQPGTGSPNAT